MNNAALVAALKESEANRNSLQQTKLDDNYAELNATVEELRREIQIVKGKVEEVEHSIQKGRPNVSAGPQAEDSRVSQLEDRILQLEQYMDLESPVAGKKPPVVAIPEKTAPPESAKKDLSETELYNTSKQALDRGEFEASRASFADFLKRFPNSANADNAQFWIGESYYREKWYEKAIMEYQKVIETYPDGNKIPSALLKQGLSFFNLNEKANARLILKEIIKKYPTSNEAKIAKDKLDTFN
jgi:tol-pal system protein YbgF